MTVRGERTAKGIWDLLKKNFEKRSRMFMVDLRQRLQDERCGEGDDVGTHFDTMHTMREDLSTITATVSVTNTALDPEALMVSIIIVFCT